MGVVKEIRKLQEKRGRNERTSIPKCHGTLLFDDELVNDAVHESPIVSIVYNPRKKHLLTSDNSFLRIYEGRNRDPIKTVALPKDSTTTGLIYNYIHDVYYAMYNQMNIKVYSAKPTQLLLEVCTRDTQDRSIGAIAFWVKEQMIITAGVDGLIQFWHTNPMPSDRSTTGRRYEIERGDWFVDPLRTPTSKWISHMHVDERTGRLFCVADVDVMVWDIEEKSLLYRLCELHDLPITAFAFYPANQYVITASADRTIKVWAFEDRDKIHLVEVLLGHSRGVSSILLHPESGTLLSSGADGAVKWWSIDKAAQWDSLQVIGFSGAKSECLEMSDAGDAMPGSIAFMGSLRPEGRQLACVVGHLVVMIEFHNISSALVEAPDTISNFEVIHKPPASLTGGGPDIGRLSNALEVAGPPEKQVLVVSKAGTIEFVGAALGHGSKVIAPSAPEMKEETIQVYTITAVMLAGNANRLFVGWDMGNVDVYNLSTSQRLYTLPISDLDPTPISCICHAQLSPHTELNVAGFGSSKQAARMKAAMIGSIWLSNAGKNIVVVGSMSGRIVLTYFNWDVKRKRSIQAHQGGVLNIQHVQDRRQLFTAGCKDGKIKVWDLRSRALFSLAATISCGHEKISCFSPRWVDGAAASQLVVGFDDGGLEFWDTSEEVIHRLKFGSEEEENAAEEKFDNEQDEKRARATSMVAKAFGPSKMGALLKGLGGSEGRNLGVGEVGDIKVPVNMESLRAGAGGRNAKGQTLGGDDESETTEEELQDEAVEFERRVSSLLTESEVTLTRANLRRRISAASGGSAAPAPPSGRPSVGAPRARRASVESIVSEADREAAASPSSIVGEQYMQNERDAVGGQLQLTTPLQVVEDFHKGRVLSVATSACGKFIASSAKDNCILLWDARRPGDFKVLGRIPFRHPITKMCEISDGSFDLLISSGPHLGMVTTSHLHPAPEVEIEEFKYQVPASRFQDKGYTWDNPTRIQRVSFMEANSMEARELDLRLNEIKALGSNAGMKKGGHLLSAKKMRELEEGMPDAVYRERRRELAIRNGETLPQDVQPAYKNEPGSGPAAGGMPTNVPRLKLGGSWEMTAVRPTARLEYKATEVDHLNKSMIIPNTARPAVRTALSAASGQVVHNSQYWAELMKCAPPELPSARARKATAIEPKPKSTPRGGASTARSTGGGTTARSTASLGGGGAGAGAGGSPKKTPRKKKGGGRKKRRARDERINPTWNLIIHQQELPHFKSVMGGANGRQTIFDV